MADNGIFKFIINIKIKKEKDMKGIFSKVWCYILSVLLLLPLTILPSINVRASGGTIDDFVERCYKVALDRGSDPEGFAYWKGLLTNGKMVGNTVAYGFIFSEEYTNKGKTNEEYVTDLYALFMGREPDADGYNYWLNKLSLGESRVNIFAGFANSEEFYLICKSYGISAGWYVVGYDKNQINNVNLFVERLYKICLGRIGDQGGQKNWVERLITKQITGAECARCFIQSPEYINNKLSDEDFVENLYLSMMGRASDSEGKINWVSALKNGTLTRDEVFAGFVNSQEFGNICNSYGIDKGSYTATTHNAKYTYEVVIDKEMLNLVNAYRVENGLNELSWESDAEQVAKDRIEAIAKGGVLSHDAAGGPPSGCVAENLFQGKGGWSSEKIFNGYKKSPGHDANMKNKNAKSCVIATCNVSKSIGGLSAYDSQWNIQIYY